jgi:hypothetical protein
MVSSSHGSHVASGFGALRVGNRDKSRSVGSWNCPTGLFSPGYALLVGSLPPHRMTWVPFAVRVGCLYVAPPAVIVLLSSSEVNCVAILSSFPLH